ncbi:hypothetical protein BV210_19435 (plasmid) [Halorientalis sp. IM1011]|nr:hypothetical protein BV210_19435 [Halorientalis sp. IM1011]
MAGESLLEEFYGRAADPLVEGPGGVLLGDRNELPVDHVAGVESSAMTWRVVPCRQWSFRRAVHNRVAEHVAPL